MASTGAGGAPAVKGLRLITMSKGPDGYGFHMYTDKKLQGQYIKSVTKESPADLCGMIPGDHVLAVDGVDCSKETHHQVVDRVRAEPSIGKKVLVIDQQTEQDMLAKGVPIHPANAIVMVPRSPPSDEPDGGALSELNMDLKSAIPKNKKKDIKSKKNWADSVAAYNDL
ncbi:hypothetical protein EMCRGX_G023572 [Ephydatia muelleri]|eukprot:Em0017g156a